MRDLLCRGMWPITAAAGRAGLSRPPAGRSRGLRLPHGRLAALGDRAEEELLDLRTPCRDPPCRATWAEEPRQMSGSGRERLSCPRGGHHDGAMTTAVPPLQLHPDRLLPAEPGVRADRAAALRSRAGPADHLSARPRRPAAAARRRAVPGSGQRCSCTPDHYVTRLLHASGVGLDELGVGRGPLPRSRPGRCGGCCARTGTPTAARRCGTGSRPSWATSSTSRCARRPRRRDAIYDQLAERLATDAYRPRALLRAVRDRGAGHHRRPGRRPGRARRARGRPDLVRAG